MRKIGAVIVFLLSKTVIKELFVHFINWKTVLLYPIQMDKMTFCFVSIQRSGCIDFSYRGSMLQN